MGEVTIGDGDDESKDRSRREEIWRDESGEHENWERQRLRRDASREAESEKPRDQSYTVRKYNMVITKTDDG